MEKSNRMKPRKSDDFCIESKRQEKVQRLMTRSKKYEKERKRDIACSESDTCKE